MMNLKNLFPHQIERWISFVPMAIAQNGANAAFFPAMFQFANQDVGPKSAKTESDLGGDGRSPSSTDEVGNEIKELC